MLEGGFGLAKKNGWATFIEQMEGKRNLHLEVV